MVGVIESISNVTRSTFDSPGDTILLVGESREELGGSEYLAVIHDTVAGQPPVCDLGAERRAIDALLEAIESESVNSAHDLSDGGLAVALAECCIANREVQMGADVDVTDVADISSRAMLFGESQGRYLLSSFSPEIVERIMQKHGVPVRRVGTVLEKEAGFRIRFAGATLDADVESLSNAWHNAIPSMMSAPAVAAEPETAMTAV
jgi:phosphoribosylformylglycinamidine synthase